VIKTNGFAVGVVVVLLKKYVGFVAI